MSDSPNAQPAAAASLRLVIGSVAVLLLLAALDQTVVSTALPTIVADLGGLEQLSWVVTSYILASTVVAPLYGKLGDLYGRRLMVFVSVGLFLLGSLLCGIAQSMEFLIFARAVQGLGGGGLFVLALSVVGDVIPPRERGRIQGVFAAVFSLSSVIGPLIGGWFVQVASWHWIFLINLPLGLLAMAGFAAGFPAMGPRVSHKIDWTGAALLTVCLAALTLVTSLGGHAISWGSPLALTLIAVTLVALALFIATERRAAEPILPMGLFRSNVFRNTSAIGFITGAAIFGAVTFLPLYLQVAKGISPANSGFLLIPMTIGIVASSTLSGIYMGRTGRYRLLPVVGMTLVAVASVGLARLDLGTSPITFMAWLTLFGLGLGGIFPVVTTAVQNAVPRDQLGTATAAGVLFRQIGGSLGVAAFGALFVGGMAASLATSGVVLPTGVSIGPQMALSLPADLQAAVGGAIVQAISPIYWITAGLALLGLIFALTLTEVPLSSRSAPRGE
jgi:EmrB/QacA subfamily drug resistance transporter